MHVVYTFSYLPFLHLIVVVYIEEINIIYILYDYAYLCAGPYPPPNDIRLISVDGGVLTFGWSSIGPGCETIVYSISSDCGFCPNTTNATSIACSNLELSSNAKNCTFSVRSTLCGFNGQLSVPIPVTLKGRNIV